MWGVRNESSRPGARRGRPGGRGRTEQGRKITRGVPIRAPIARRAHAGAGRARISRESSMHPPATPRDRRDYARLAVGLRAVLTFVDGSVRWTEVDAGVADLSYGGMYVLCDRCPSEGQRIMLQLTSPRGPCVAVGGPVHVQQHGGFGVRFDDVNGALRAFIRTLQRLEPVEQAQVVGRVTDAHVTVVWPS